MYVSIEIVKLWNFSGRFQFKLWHFASCCGYIYFWHWRVLPRRWLQDKLWQDPEKPLSSLQFHLILWDCNTCMLRHSTETYQNQVNLVLCIFRFEITRTCSMSFIGKNPISFQNHTSQLKIRNNQDITKKIAFCCGIQ